MLLVLSWEVMAGKVGRLEVRIGLMLKDREVRMGC